MDNALPPPTQFINSILTKLSQHTRGTYSSDPPPTQTQTQRHGHPRLTQTQPASAFPASQLTNLKPLMLTLHCIFPNELLLALDILDRGLVRRVRTRRGSESGDGDGDQGSLDHDGNPTDLDQPGSRSSGREEEFFFVTSASTMPSNSRSSFPATQYQPDDSRHLHQHQDNRWQEKGYEVRLQAWNCTCPSFTISAFRDLGPEPTAPPSSTSSESDQTGNQEDDDHAPGNKKDNNNTSDASAGADVLNTNAYTYSFGGTLPLHPESAPPVCKHVLACLLATLCPELGRNGGDDGARYISLDREEIAALCAGWGG